MQEKAGKKEQTQEKVMPNKKVLKYKLEFSLIKQCRLLVGSRSLII